MQRKPISRTSEFEAALAEAAHGEGQHYVLRLYVTGTTARSSRAVQNIRELCETHLAGRHTLEVVDIYQQPELASEAQLIAAPTLVKELPEPLRKVVGDMSNLERVLLGLDIAMAG